MTPWVRQLIFTCVVVHVAIMAYPRLFYDLGFVPAAILQRPWTVVTYMFVHAPGFMHLLFNMIALFFFGPRLESRLGSRHFLRLYFIGGITGGLLSIPFSPNTIIVGASGAVFGVMLGFAYFWPTDKIFIWGVLPIEARWFVVILTLFGLFAGFTGTGGNVAHFAHLGGFLGAYLYLKWIEKRSPAKKFKRRVEGPQLGDRKTLEQWKRIRPEDLHEVNRGELERISAKIKSQGVASLTPRERTFVERFSRG